MKKSRLLLSTFLIAGLGISATAGVALPQSKMEKLRGEVSHPFAAISPRIEQDANGLISRPSLSAPFAAPATPDATATGIQSWGTLIGPDGSDWFYEQTLTANPSNPYYYGGSQVTIYDGKHQKQGEFSISIPDDVSVNVIQPYGQISKSFFDRNTSTFEVMVYIHRILSPGVATGDIAIYDNTGYEVAKYEGYETGMLVSAGNSTWDKKERFALAHYDNGEINGETVRVLQIDILRKSTYADDSILPVVEHTFVVDEETTYYTDGQLFDMKYLDGSFYYMLARYAKPYVASYDYMTGNMIYSEDNSFITEVYNQSYEKVVDINIPLETTGVMPSMHGVGLFSNKDFTKGFFSQDDQVNVIVTHYDYDVASDSYEYSFDAYGESGEVVKHIHDKVGSWMQLSSIPGEDEQIAFLLTNADGSQAYEFVNLQSAESVGVLPATVEGKNISSSLDRIECEGGYKYLVGIGEAESDSEGNVIAMSAWLNQDLSFDRFVKFNLGPQGQLYNPINYNDYVKKDLFDTDDDFDYIYIAKVKRENSSIVDTKLCVAHEDGTVIKEFMGNEEDGAYSNGSILNIDTDPMLFVAFHNTSANTFRVDYYHLPLEKFAGGSGTEEDPYHIASAGDFQQISANSSSYFVLDKDLDLSDVDWTPIVLNGGFDGNNHYIYGLSVNADNDGGCGLFAKAEGTSSQHAYIKNLIMVDTEVNGTENTSALGTLVGSAMYTDIDNVHIYYSDLQWESIYASCLGGIVGDLSLSSSVTNSTVDNVEATSEEASQVGGIAGILKNTSKIENCVANFKANVRGTVGGIAGDAGGYSSDSQILNCRSNVDITAKNDIGGIAGSSARITIANCEAKGVITATSPEYEDYSEPFYSAAGIIGTIATDWSGVETKIVKGCVANVDVNVDDPNNSTGKVYGVRGIIGAVADDFGMAGYSEKGIENCYVVEGTKILAQDAQGDDPSKPEGAVKSLADLNKDFLTGIGYAYGDSSESPWKEGEGLPVLYFEDVKLILTETDPINVDVDETIELPVVVCSSLPTEGKASVANEEYLAIDKVEGVDNVYVVTMTGIADGVTILTFRDEKSGKSVDCEVIVGSGTPSKVETIAAKTGILFQGNKVTAAEATSLQLYNAAGICLINTAKASADITDLESGLYVVVATYADGSKATLKIRRK